MLNASPRDLLAAIVESSDLAIVSKTPDGIVTSWNQAAVAMFGYTPEEAIGQSITKLFPPDRLEEEGRLQREVAAGRRVDHYQSERLRKDGTRIIVSISLFPVRDAGGAIVAAAEIIHDITEHTRFEQREQFFQRLEDAIRPLTDPVEITVTAARLLGEFLPASRCTYAVVEEDEDSYSLSVPYAVDGGAIGGRYRFSECGVDCLRTLRAGQPWVVDDVSKDERLGDWDRSAYLLSRVRAAIIAPVIKSGRLVAALSVHSAVPRAWRTDEADLVRRVANRCWEVTDRVRHDRERARLLEAAEAANRAKDEFIAMLGHELRNPLSPIVTALQLVKLRGPVPWERERTVIERQVRHLVRLVDDLLDVSRIVRGRVELKREVVEVSEIVSRAAEMASPLLEERAQTLTIDVPRTGLAVDADPARLSQVLANLMTNAAKYTPQRGWIHIRAGREGNEVLLSVKDTGIGIAPDILPSVFDLFVQGRQSIDRAGGGLGLGLAIVRNLVERHGGRVSAQSEGVGRGSEFTIRLPITERMADASAAPARVLRPTEVNGDMPRARILIVDDNEDAAEMLKIALHERGHETWIAHDGLEALRIASRVHPDVAFLDIGLPVMDGYELAARLKRLPQLEHLKLIALTGYGQESDRQRTKAAGFHHHLVKPLDLTELEPLITPQAGTNK